MITITFSSPSSLSLSENSLLNLKSGYKKVYEILEKNPE